MIVLRAYSYLPSPDIDPQNNIIMKTILCAFAVFLVFSTQLKAQSDSITVNNQNDLLSEISSPKTDSVQLLPDKMIFTQRLLWGENGLMRKSGKFALNNENRMKELKIRRTMLVAHQILGITTLGGMVAQGFVGSKLYNGNQSVKDVHETLAGGINLCYFGTAALALFAPPKLINERKGYSSIKVHRALAIVHLTGMIATNILAGQLEAHPDLKPYHRAAAFTAFGALAASMIVIKF